MNLSLRREIILNIFQTFGVGVEPDHLRRLQDDLLSPGFLLDRKIDFESETGKHQGHLWTASTKLEDGGLIKVIIADLSEENFSEYVLLIQLNDFLPFAVRLSSEPDDAGMIAFLAEKKWVLASTLFQAKLLVATEALLDVLVFWDRLIDYQGMYHQLISFLQFDNEAL